MNRKVYFTYTPTKDERCLIVPFDYENFPFSVEGGGSYNVAPARVLGLSYADYLRFLRDSFPEQVILEGKGGYYVKPFWKFSPEMIKFIDLLNVKMNSEVDRIEKGLA